MTPGRMMPCFTPGPSRHNIKYPESIFNRSEGQTKILKFYRLCNSMILSTGYFNIVIHFKNYKHTSIESTSIYTHISTSLFDYIVLIIITQSPYTHFISPFIRISFHYPFSFHFAIHPLSCILLGIPSHDTLLFCRS